MTNMRRGFTMIELIFVIVIIGILAAVAIPRLAGTANEARKATVTGFLGTLNRSVGPTMWAATVAGGGSVKALTLTNYTEIPDGITITGGLAACGAPTAEQNIPGGTIDDPNNPGQTIPDPDNPPQTIPATSGYVEIATIDSLPVQEILYCLDGTPIDSPKFAFSEGGDQALQNNN